MALYVMMTNLTDEGRKTVKTNPQRIKEVNKEVEAMGVKILRSMSSWVSMTSSTSWKQTATRTLLK